jgi:carbonic anhydrase
MKRAVIVAAVVVVGAAVVLAVSPKNQFIVGGALVNVGFRMQDHLHSYDFQHHEDITAEQVWTEFKRQNELSASVRERFPRSTEHPVVAMLVCMDARIDTSELAGDTRRYYYIVRTAGSVLGPPEQEMLELAVANGVKLLVLTRHTDCAAEKAAKDPAKRAAFPTLVAAVDEREQRVAEFLDRPLIKERIAQGQLLVKQLVIDTTEDLLVTSFSEAKPVPAAAPAHHEGAAPAPEAHSEH